MTVKVYGMVPPSAVSVNVYGLPTVPWINPVGRNLETREYAERVLHGRRVPGAVGREHSEVERPSLHGRPAEDAGGSAQHHAGGSDPDTCQLTAPTPPDWNSGTV